jgi:hypothetical protein
MKMQKKLVLSLLSVLAFSTAASRAHADETIPIAPVSNDDTARFPPTSTRWKLIVGGLGLTGAAYGATLASGFIWPDVPGSTAMKIPIVGPWIALGQDGCAKDNPDCGAILYVRGALEVLSGIVQASGLGLVGEGIFMTTEADGKKPSNAHFTIMPTPIVSRTTTGFGVMGTF